MVSKLTDVIKNARFTIFYLSFYYQKSQRRNKLHEKVDVTIMLYAYSGVRSSNVGPATG